MAYTNCDLILSVKDAENHEKWLKTRDLGIGGSDAAVIMGMNSYKSPYQLWMEKTGQADPEDLTGNMSVYWGTKNEPAIANWFQEETGKKVKRLGTLQSREYPFMLANIDREVCGENAGLEIKTAGISQREYWQGDNIPDAYYVQCLHYMAVTGADYWYIAVLIGGNEAVYKRIERNEEDVQTLIKAEAKFWELVEAKTPPEVDNTKSCGEALGWQYRDTAKITVDLPLDALSILHDMDDAKTLKKELTERITGYENELKAMLQDAEAGTVGDYTVTWKPTKPRETVSLSAIKKKAPAIYRELAEKDLITIGDSTRRFYYKQAKGDDAE